MKIFQAMKRLIAITIILLSIASCTFVNVSRTLNDVESYIMERPDSALAVLESIDRDDLNTTRTKAHHALLHAMALDKNFIDVSDDSIARVAVDYFSKHGPQKYHARSLYYLGLAYYYQEDYNKAIVEFTKAEEVAEACDSLYLGMIKGGQAFVYKKTYNPIEEINCLNKAYEIYSSLSSK
jgi:tetratricopeptide (TPR) repeat protein